MARIEGFQWVQAPVPGLPYRDDDNQWKLVWHSTETRPYRGAAAGLSRIHKNPPQLWVDVYNRERVQGIDTSLAGRALKASPDVETNRDRVIQIELIGYARDMHLLTDDQLDWLATAVVRPIIAHHPIPNRFLQCQKIGENGNTAYPPSKIRLDARAWDNYSGHLGHQHAPRPNAHLDPGGLNLERICRTAYNGAPTIPPGDDDVPYTQWSKEDKQAFWDDFRLFGAPVITGSQVDSVDDKQTNLGDVVNAVRES
mgnify:CR=1 FL=1